MISIQNDLRIIEKSYSYDIVAMGDVEGQVCCGLMSDDIFFYKYPKYLQPTDNFDEIVSFFKRKSSGFCKPT